MNTVFRLLPTHSLPSDLCDIIYLFAGIKTPSCQSMSLYIDSINKHYLYNPSDTIWAYHIRTCWKPPPALRVRPAGAWRTQLDLDILVAYHTMMIQYYNSLDVKTNIHRSNLFWHQECIDITYAFPHVITRRIT